MIKTTIKTIKENFTFMGRRFLKDDTCIITEKEIFHCYIGDRTNSIIAENLFTNEFDSMPTAIHNELSINIIGNS
jgi:hypothetical protein